MKTNVFLVVATAVMLLSSCESKFSKLTNEAVNDMEDYIDAFNNAKSADEIRIIESEWKKKGEYYENEFEKIDNEISIREKQKFYQENKNLGDEVKKARRDAHRRFN